MGTHVNSSAVALIGAARIFLRFDALINALRSLSKNMGYPQFFSRMRLAALSTSKLLDFNPDGSPVSGLSEHSVP